PPQILLPRFHLSFDIYALYPSLNFLTTNAELVPPNPKELDKYISNSCFIVRETKFNSLMSSSGSSKLMLGARNPCSVIRVEYTIADAPAIQHLGPVMDFEQLTYGVPPYTSKMACASLASPSGVDVACALI